MLTHFFPNLPFGAWAFVRAQNINKSVHRATNTTFTPLHNAPNGTVKRSLRRRGSRSEANEWNGNPRMCLQQGAKAVEATQWFEFLEVNEQQIDFPSRKMSDCRKAHNSPPEAFHEGRGQRESNIFTHSFKLRNSSMERRLTLWKNFQFFFCLKLRRKCRQGRKSSIKGNGRMPRVDFEKAVKRRFSCYRFSPFPFSTRRW